MSSCEISCRLEKFHDDLKLLEEFHDSGVSRDDLSSYYAFQKAWCEDFIFVMHGLPYMGDSEPPHQTFCVSLVLVSFTLIYRAAYSLLVKHSTIITSEERASEIPSYQLLGT